MWLLAPGRRTTLLTQRFSASFDERIAKKSERPLLAAIYDSFRSEILLGGFCQLIASILQAINPFILKYLIDFASQEYEAHSGTGGPASSVGRGIGIVVCMSMIQMAQSICTNHFLYQSMMVGGQTRAVLMSLIFNKSLRLSGRAVSESESVGVTQSGSSEAIPSNIKPRVDKRRFFEKRLNLWGRKAARENQPVSQRRNEAWTEGRIINLMSVDTYRVDQAAAMLHMAWTAPISILATLVLLLVNISYFALAGFGLLAITMPLLGKAIDSLLKRRKTINSLTDRRVSLTHEVLKSIRFLKCFAWETSFMNRINSIRGREIRSIQILLAIRNGIMAISTSMPTFASILSFCILGVTKHSLDPATVFSSLALFSSLRMPLNYLPLVIGLATDAMSSISRIEDFLLAAEAEEEFEWDSQNSYAIVARIASFTWEHVSASTSLEGKSTRRENQSYRGILHSRWTTDYNKSVKREADKQKPSNICTGSPGAVKVEIVKPPSFAITELDFKIARDELVAVIGPTGSGKSSLLAALAGNMRKLDGFLTLGGSRAFCSQDVWIQNATVRDNVLFGKEMEVEWYHQVIDACNLRVDLNTFPNGDLTEIGERGVTCSGGQKQRLSIARATYRNPDIILMDDPLSAVDAHVGRHIMDEAICGLLKDKCRILATHQTWVLSRCHRVICMENGQITAMDTYANIKHNPAFVKLVAKSAHEGKGKTQEIRIAKLAKEEWDRTIQEDSTKPSTVLMQAEDRAEGSVSLRVYHAYLKASGSILVMPIVLGFLIFAQVANIMTGLWLSWWIEEKFQLSNGGYIGIYVTLGLAQAFLNFIFSFALSYYGAEASKALFQQAFTRVLRAPMSFFDTTPLGRITNRFSKDIDVMDNMLTDAIRYFVITLFMIFSVFILVLAFYYYFLAALVPLAIIFILASNFYRASAREIKRHESLLRSHLYAKFSEALGGVSTIRAYGLRSQFSQTVCDAIDNMNSAYFLTFANQRWLSIRLDVIGCILIFVVGSLVVTSRFSIPPSAGGLVLAYLLSIAQLLTFSVRQLAEIDNNMNATERIYHYCTELDQEAPIQAKLVENTWPERGEIIFNEVEMRYRGELPMVLTQFSLHIRGGERIGVVGRTGAGKSSIISALFRLVEISGGSILIDGLNISTIGLKDLRSRLSIIPQDPTLFRGTIRSNLDPFNVYTDERLWSTLRRTGLTDSTLAAADKSGRINLDTPVEEEGRNFSLGQRQLLALARAIICQNQIILCDEATSNVDLETDQRIQETIQDCFKGKTIICIAHRLRTVLNYDRICVLDRGRIVELGRPIDLFESGMTFRQLSMAPSL
ncbi:unnamed protein product [Penicillium viridicatum]